MSVKTSDVLIVGGGVIGLSLAYELAGQGVGVRLLEQGQCGREASWAGAGILPPGNFEAAATPESQLRSLSCQRWPSLTQRLREETGIDNGFVTCGGLEVRGPLTEDSCPPEDAHPGETGSLRDEADQWQREGVAVSLLTAEQLREKEPALSETITAGYHLPQLAQVRNPRHLKALLAACAARGVELCSGEAVETLQRAGNRITAVQTATGTFSAGRVCLCGGAWSARLLRPFLPELPLVPVRGQIVLLAVPRPLFRHVIQAGPRYLVPRPDGRVLIGSTEEWVGFDKRNTAAAVAELLAFGTRLIPRLAGATLERTWAGLRPRTADGLPCLGRVGEVENLYVAAGHFRAGLQMSPGTAVVMSEQILGRETSIDLSPFAPDRFPGSNTR